MLKKSKKIIPFGILLLSVVIFTISCRPGGANDEAQEEVVFAVSAYQVTSTSLDDYLEFGGDVVAASSVDILPDSTGKLLRIYVSVGDYVERNQILADIDPSRPGMTYESSPLRAPTAGTISSFPLSVGSTVAPSMSVGKISSTGMLEVQAAVAERFVSRVALGQEAELTLDAWPSDVFMASITEVSPVLDAATRTMAVKLVPEDVTGEKIKPGMYARVKLITEEKENVFVVPYHSLIIRDDEAFAFIVKEDETAFQQKVTLGLRVDDKVEIIEGLQEGDLVVTRGQTLLNDGTKVSVVSVETEEGGE